MSEYLELNPDQMVDLLSDLQKKAREMIRLGHPGSRAKPYSEKKHKQACSDFFDKAKWLAKQGDVI